MAKQTGILKLQGSVGGFTFVKTQDGYIAKEKTSISAKRIASDPAFERTRENNAEFGRAGTAAKLLRNATHSLLQNAKDAKLSPRLTKEMMRVLKADTTSIRGQRNIPDGDISLLLDFDFNFNAPFKTIFYPAYTTNIDRATGILSVNIPALLPANDISVPESTTHFTIVSAAAEMDFANEKYVDSSTASAVLPWDNNTSVVNLTHNLTANSTFPLLLLLGIQFFQQVNGINYTLKNGSYNPLSIIKIDTL